MSYTYRKQQSILKTLRDNQVITCEYKLNCNKSQLQSMFNKVTPEQIEYAERYIHSYEVINSSNDDTINDEYGVHQPSFGTPLNQSRRFGVELEMEHHYHQDNDDVIYNLTSSGIDVTDEYGEDNEDNNNQWTLETDGSLSSRGRELVSPPLTLNQLEQVKVATESMINQGFFTNNNCGTHIHLEATDMTKGQLVKYFRVFQELEQMFVKKAGRHFNRYSQSINEGIKVNGNCKSFKKLVEAVRHDRYHSLNVMSFLKHGTLEIRMLAGTLSYDKIQSWVQMHHSILEYSLTHSIKETVKWAKGQYK